MNPLTSILASLLAADQGSPLTSLLFIVPLAVLGYMMFTGPKKQRQKQAELVASLEPGDEVVTSGGIHGHITHIEDDVIEIEVDTDVVLRVSKSAVSRGPAKPATDDDQATVDDEPSNGDAASRKRKK